MSDFAILLGSKNYSSWSLRPWLALKHCGVAFDETVVTLRAPDFAERVRAWSPAGRVPVLRHGKTYVWDSLAICEYLAEAFPAKELWPRDRETRALARAVSAEMHSGFQTLRSTMPMNVRARGRKVKPTPDLEKDIARILEIWKDCRARASGGGPYLFGAFSIADAMFAPVAFRFQTYGVASDYAESLVATPEMREWAEASARETNVIPDYEVGK